MSNEKIPYRGYSIYPHGKQFRVWAGKELKQQLVDSEEDAKRIIDELISKKNEAEKISSLRTITIADALKEWEELAVSDNGKDKTTIRNVKLQYSNIDQSLYINDITDVFVKEKVWKPNHADSTRATNLFNIRSLVSFCKDRGYLVSQSLFNLPTPDRTTKKQKTIATDADVEWVQMWTANRAWQIQALVYAFVYWGIRPDNITGLKKADWKREQRVVVLPPTVGKNKTEGEMLVFKELEPILEKCVRENKSEYLFESSDGKPWSIDGVQGVMKRMHKDGLDPKITWYSFRVRNDNLIASKGVSAMDHAKMMNHSMETVLKHYHRFDAEKVASQMEEAEYFIHHYQGKQYKFDTYSALNRHMREIKLREKEKKPD